MAGKLPKSYSALCAAFLCACMLSVNAQTLIDKIDTIRQTDALIVGIESAADLHELTYEYEARESKNTPLLSYAVSLKQNADLKTVKAVIRETGDGWQYVYTAWFTGGKAAARRRQSANCIKNTTVSQNRGTSALCAHFISATTAFLPSNTKTKNRALFWKKNNSTKNAPQKSCKSCKNHYKNKKSKLRNRIIDILAQLPHNDL